jgi:hypothetical protein
LARRNCSISCSRSRAADHDGRVVTVGQLVLFSTETGDAWLLDPADQLAARLARDGEPEPIHIEETIPPSRSAGRAAIASKAPPSSTSITIPLSSQPSLATRRISSNRPILKFQICLASLPLVRELQCPSRPPVPGLFWMADCARDRNSCLPRYRTATLNTG